MPRHAAKKRSARKVKSKDGSARSVIVWNAEYYSGSLASARQVGYLLGRRHINLLTFFTFRVSTVQRD